MKSVVLSTIFYKTEFTSHLPPYSCSSIRTTGSEPIRAGVKGHPQLCGDGSRCDTVLFPRSGHNDGLLLCVALNTVRQRRISPNPRKAFHSEASEWLNEK